MIKPFYLFGIERKVQLMVGNEQFGAFYTIFNFTLILHFINDFGIQNYVSRLVSQKERDARSEVGVLIELKSILAIIYLLLTFVLSIYWFGNNFSPTFILHIAVNQVLVSVIFFLRANISGLGLYFTDTLLSILDRTILILTMGYFLYIPVLHNPISVNTFVWAQSWSLLITVVICLVLLYRHHFTIQSFEFKFSAIKKVIKVCLPFSMVYLGYSLLTKGDSLWLEHWLIDGKVEAGLYASCFRLYEALTIVALSFAGLLLPMFSKIVMDLKKLNALLGISLILLWLISLFCGLTGCFYSSWINELINHDKDMYRNQIIGLLSIAFIPASINFIFGVFFQAVHKESLLYKIYFGLALLSIILNYWFIPQYRGIASAFIFLIHQIVLTFISFWIIRAHLTIIFEKMKQIIFHTLLVILTFIGINQMSLNIWVSLLSLIALFTISIPITGIINLGEMRRNLLNFMLNRKSI